jgi:hypothetical protein
MGSVELCMDGILGGVMYRFLGGALPLHAGWGSSNCAASGLQTSHGCHIQQTRAPRVPLNMHEYAVWTAYQLLSPMNMHENLLDHRIVATLDSWRHGPTGDVPRLCWYCRISCVCVCVCVCVPVTHGRFQCQSLLLALSYQPCWHPSWLMSGLINSC